jgi:tetratricopeptide (TPR) repeat protein
MAASSEIEKLERRYAENPDGRYFAPLSDAYRKAGQVDRALELVRAGLEKHADYLSAHIVLGRCLLDKKDDEGAGQAFRRVLTLDSENIIALKSLAEIEERKGDLVQARQWLQQLLHIDPMNADAEADLARLGGAIASAPPTPIEAVTVELPPVEARFSFADVLPADEPPQPPEFLPPHPPEAPPTAPEGPTVVVDSEGIVASQFTPPTVEVPVQELEIKPFDDSLAWDTGERSSRSVSQADIERALHEHESSLTETSQLLEPPEGAAGPPVAAEPISTEDAWASGASDESSGSASLQTTVPDLGAVEVDSGDSAGWDTPGAEEPAPELTLPEPELTEDGLRDRPSGMLEMPELAPAEMGAEPSLADLPIIMPEDVTPAEEMARPSARQTAAVPEAPAGEAEFTGLQVLAEPTPEPPAAEPETPPLLTETMGDLYLRQGFSAEAADVYRRLIEQRPDDVGLMGKLASIEGPPPSLSAAALGTESSRSWLQRLAQSRIAGPVSLVAPEPSEGPSPMEQAFSQSESVPGPVGEPTRPATDSFTLDAIFGAQGGAAVEPAPAPPPVAAPAPPTGTSFDAFFGAPPEDGSVRPDTDTQSAPPPEDDINSFNSWLRGLKR